MPPMYRRPWYTKLADAAHRLTVLGIIGFSVYLAHGIGMTLYANRDTARRARIEQEQQVRKNPGNEVKAINVRPYINFLSI
jgi:cytochrome c oxidase assembly factor 14